MACKSLARRRGALRVVRPRHSQLALVFSPARSLSRWAGRRGGASRGEKPARLETRPSPGPVKTPPGGGSVAARRPQRRRTHTASVQVSRRLVVSQRAASGWSG